MHAPADTAVIMGNFLDSGILTQIHPITDQAVKYIRKVLNLAIDNLSGRPGAMKDLRGEFNTVKGYSENLKIS